MCTRGSSYHAGEDSKLHVLSSPFSSANTDRTESCLFLIWPLRLKLELLTSCSMLDDLPLVLMSCVVDSACTRSEVGVSSCMGDDQGSDILRLGVMFRLGSTRAWNPFFRSCSLRFARVVPGPESGDDFCSVPSMSAVGRVDVVGAIVHDECNQSLVSRVTAWTLSWSKVVNKDSCELIRGVSLIRSCCFCR